MNFDDLKKSWQEQEAPNLNIDSKKALDEKSSRLPLEKIRRNVKKEIWIQIISVLLVAFTPKILMINKNLEGGFYLFYILFVIICIFYIYKMYVFYKTSATLSLNSKDSVYESYFSIKLYIQLYESFCYSLIPFGILLLFLVSSQETLNQVLNGNINALLKLSIPSVVMLVLIYFIAKYWVRKMYGQYLGQIECTLNQLKEQE
jgi:cation transport ATPase